MRIFLIYSLLGINCIFGNNTTNTTEIENTIQNILAQPVMLSSTNETEDTNETLDIMYEDFDPTIFEVGELNKYVRIAKTRRDQWYIEANQTFKRGYDDLWWLENRFLGEISMRMMRQSIYATRERLQETRKLRKMFINDPAYNLAVIYGMLMQLRMKLDNLYSTMRGLRSDGPFIHLLTLYERTLVCTTDIDVLVKQMFEIQEIYFKEIEKMMGS